MKRLVMAAMCCAGVAYGGNSCRDGVAKAVPLPGGKAPAIDGCLDDWDKSGEVLCWNAEAFADKQNCSLFFMYDEANLYLGAEMGLHDHDPKNDNRPEDRYWWGDLIQLRLCSDPKMPYPLPRALRNNKDPRLEKNDRVTCVNIWKNTLDGSDNLLVTPGAFFDCGKNSHPDGSAVKIVENGRHLTFEARIPWSAVGVKDGKMPFKPGERMAAIADIKWFPGTDGHYTAAIFNTDPGAFAFLNIHHWGQIEFSAKGNLPPLKESYADIAEAARKRDAIDTTGYAEIKFNLPKKAKVSVNLFDDKGGVVRELAGGELHEAGEVKFWWDGRDSLGFPCEAGREYRWGAYAHDGLDVEYFGTVGTSGNPPYETKDRKGGWGSDHGPVVDAACDETGRYYVWHMSESGCAIVKTDYNGDVVWRSNPFVLTGWGNYTCLAASGGKVFLVFEERKGNGKPVIRLVRVDAATGNYEIFPDGSGAQVIAADENAPKLPAKCAVRDEYAFNCAGIAVIGNEVFISDFNGNRVFVHDTASGKQIREISGITGPRGLWAHNGELYAAAIPGAVYRINAKTGAAVKVVSEGLEAPHGIAVLKDGSVAVSDLGESQQVKIFGADGKLVKTLGKKGGRGYLGKIDFGAFCMPFGLAADANGILMVPEASSPKIVNLIDAKNWKTVRRYFGYTAYSPSNVADCDDPFLQYYSLSGPGGFARARLPEGGGTGLPDASWDFESAGFPDLGCVMNTMNMPEVVKAKNGRKYLSPDGVPEARHPTMAMTICLIEGDDVKPVAGCYRLPKKNKRDRNDGSFVLWRDMNGDGKMQEDERSAPVSEVEGKKFRLAHVTGAIHFDKDGNLFLLTMDNFVIGIPCAGFAESGAPLWETEKAYIAIPKIIPELGDKMFCTWRQGLVGMRRDKDGNFYSSVACSPKYATPEYTKYMRQGMGHTADVGAVFLTKHDAKGNLVWRVGRKAVGGMKDGEILHHWCHAGLVNDKYSVAASEWGVFTFYTSDGFYVDHVFDVPGLPGRGIPYSFGGEDFSGQVRYYPQRDEVWAFNAGHTFRVKGFANGKVKGEWRTEGKVKLEKVMPLKFPGAKEKPLSKVAVKREGGMVKFSAHAADATPLVNVARQINAVFKGGDAIGFEMGPATSPKEIPERKPSGRKIGYTRILAARIGGADKVIAFKPFTEGEKRPQEYATPAGGTSAFEYCGEVPGAKVEFAPDADGKGYSAKIEIPEAFFELDFAKPVYWDAQLLLSGDGGRGLQTVEKTYLHNPDSSATTMVDDVPTEARLHPAGWKEMK